MGLINLRALFSSAHQKWSKIPCKYSTGKRNKNSKFFYQDALHKQLLHNNYWLYTEAHRTAAKQKRGGWWRIPLSCFDSGFLAKPMKWTPY